LIDGLFGLRGDVDGLHIQPQLPRSWHEVEVKRIFRGTVFHIKMKRNSNVKTPKVIVDGIELKQPIISSFEKDRYEVTVLLPI